MIPTFPEPVRDHRSLRERISQPAVRLSAELSAELKERREDAALLRRLARRLERDETTLRRLH